MKGKSAFLVECDIDFPAKILKTHNKNPLFIIPELEREIQI